MKISIFDITKQEEKKKEIFILIFLLWYALIIIYLLINFGINYFCITQTDDMQIIIQSKRASAQFFPPSRYFFTPVTKSHFTPMLKFLFGVVGKIFSWDMRSLFFLNLTLLAFHSIVTGLFSYQIFKNIFISLIVTWLSLTDPIQFYCLGNVGTLIGSISLSFIFLTLITFDQYLEKNSIRYFLVSLFFYTIALFCLELGLLGILLTFIWSKLKKPNLSYKYILVYAALTFLYLVLRRFIFLLFQYADFKIEKSYIFYPIDLFLSIAAYLNPFNRFDNLFVDLNPIFLYGFILVFLLVKVSSNKFNNIYSLSLREKRGIVLIFSYVILSIFFYQPLLIKKILE